MMAPSDLFCRRIDASMTSINPAFAWEFKASPEVLL
jgi:hypothetical protein